MWLGWIAGYSFVTMARLVLCVLALFVAGGLATPVRVPHKIEDQTFPRRLLESLYLNVRTHEPVVYPEGTEPITWDIEKNIEHYNNATAVKIYASYFKDGLLPRGMPFSILEPNHRFEAVTLFNVLYSAKDWETFYRTAVHFRTHVNEYLFTYIYHVALLHRRDTQGMIIPPLYEVFPSFFHNGEIMTTAQRIHTHGKSTVDYYPSTFVWNDNVVIKWNATIWPYYNEDIALSYFTSDPAYNSFHYNLQLTYPFWLGGETCHLAKDRRGEIMLYLQQSILARYYMERLSNGLGEIPVLGLDVVQEGHPSGLLYPNGVPFPVRPNHFHLDQPEFVDDIIKITDYERRIRTAIEQGYYINTLGEHVSLRTPESVDVLGNLIESNVDSPNPQYYKDFISIWKLLLGNSHIHDHQYYHNEVPLVLPSVLEQYQTALRDPASYMIWKRVLSLYTLWQQQLPHYRPEELAVPSVNIESVEVDKMVTYFEYGYYNVSNHLYYSQEERKARAIDIGVLVQRPQLNHRDFEIRVNVKSDVAKTVVVNFFLAPKYDSQGYEIPLHENTKHFFHFEQFHYELPQGASVIRRKSSENVFFSDEWTSGYEVYHRALKTIHEGGQFVLDQGQSFVALPRRLLLPKGRIGGMPFVLMVYINEYQPPTVPYGTGFDPIISLGLGSGARATTADPLGFPLNRPLYQWQIRNVHNLAIRDVMIFHKPTPEIDVPHTQ